MNNFDLFWLENCPAGNGYWGTKACYYWLLKEFSKTPALGKRAIRVRTTSELEGRAGGEGFVFWRDGEPVQFGNQYSVGARLRQELLDSRYDFCSLVGAWQEKNYDLWSMTIGELNSKTGQVIGDIPVMKIVRAERGLSIDARNAGWDSQYPLVQEVV